jgi:hypothetical protein
MHVQEGQACVVPSGEGDGVLERAPRDVREVDRAENVANLDHVRPRSVV